MHAKLFFPLSSLDAQPSSVSGFLPPFSLLLVREVLYSTSSLLQPLCYRLPLQTLHSLSQGSFLIQSQ